MLTLIARIIADHQRRRIVLLLAGVVASVVIGGALFAGTDHVPVSTGLYWAVVTATTVGYGDVTPANPVSRWVAVGVMLTAIPMLAGVFALVTSASVSAGLRRFLAMESHFPTRPYRIVVGMHRCVPAMLDELVRAGDAVVLLADVDPATIRHGVHVVRGDPTSLTAIRSAHAASAQHALVVAESDGDVLVSAVLLREEAPDLPISALVRSTSVREALRELGAHLVVAEDELVAHTLAKSLETPHAADLVLALVDSDQLRLVEVPAGEADVGKPLSRVRDAPGRTGIVLGIVHDGHLDLAIGEDPVLVAGDSLLSAEPIGKERSRRARGRADRIESAEEAKDLVEGMSS